MPAYSFKERFVPMILDGTKTQTIRANRKGRQGHAKPGDPVYLYFGMRTKWCRKLGEGICHAVMNLTITEDGNVLVGPYPMDDLGKSKFAWDDGFRPEGSTKNEPGESFELMMHFWRQTHSLPFEGKVIYWNRFKPTP